MNILNRIFYCPIYPKDRPTDTEMNHLMDKFKFEPFFYENELISDCRVKIGDHIVWVAGITNPTLSLFGGPDVPRLMSDDSIIDLCVFYNTYKRTRERVISDLTSWLINNKPISLFNKKQMEAAYKQYVIDLYA